MLACFSPFLGTLSSEIAVVGPSVALLSIGTRLLDSIKAADALEERGIPCTVADARYDTRNGSFASLALPPPYISAPVVLATLVLTSVHIRGVCAGL